MLPSEKNSSFKVKNGDFHKITNLIDQIIVLILIFCVVLIESSVNSCSVCEATPIIRTVRCKIGQRSPMIRSIKHGELLSERIY